MVGALIPFIFMCVLCVFQNRGGALIVVPQRGRFLSLWSTGRSGGGRLERLAHVLKLADRHVDGNVENVDGEALQSAERVVETLKEKRKDGRKYGAQVLGACRRSLSDVHINLGGSPSYLNYIVLRVILRG